jgi:hypothetical protein
VSPLSSFPGRRQRIGRLSCHTSSGICVKGCYPQKGQTMSKWSAKVEAEQAAHEATRRELAKVSESHGLMRDFINTRGLAGDFVDFLQDRAERDLTEEMGE